MPNPSHVLLGEIPFVWDYHTQNSTHSDLPERLPFTIGNDPHSGALVQVADQTIREALSKAYRAGSVIIGVETPQVPHSGAYGDAFFEFAQSVLGTNLRGRRCLEIGSGHGGLLSRLHRAGADVVGLEPGAHGQDIARQLGIRVVQDFFPTPELDGPFDAILACHVLEHVERADTFLAGVRRLLSPGGKFLVAVPDCTPCISAGDPSMFVHEHFFYHTRSSLSRMLAHAGLQATEITAATFGGSLYAACAVSPGPSSVEPEVESPFDTFCRAYAENKDRAASALNKMLTTGDELGIYMPMRALNLLALSGIPVERIRFFDDDPNMHGKRLLGFPRPVESRQQLLDRPPERLIIMSHTFGEKLREELAPKLPATTRVLTWRDVVANE